MSLTTTSVSVQSSAASSPVSVPPLQTEEPSVKSGPASVASAPKTAISWAEHGNDEMDFNTCPTVGPAQTSAQTSPARERAQSNHTSPAPVRLPTPAPSIRSSEVARLPVHYFIVTNREGLHYNRKPTLSRDSLMRDGPLIPVNSVVVCSEIVREAGYPGCPESIYARCLGFDDERWINVKACGKLLAWKVDMSKNQRMFQVVEKWGCQFRRCPRGPRVPNMVAKQNEVYFRKRVADGWVEVNNGLWLPISVPVTKFGRTTQIRILREMDEYEPTRGDVRSRRSNAAPAASRTVASVGSVSNPNKGDCSRISSAGSSIPPAMSLIRKASWNYAAPNATTPLPKDGW